MFTKIISYLYDQMMPMGFAFILLLSVHNITVIEKIRNNKKSKILLCITIVMYYILILYTVIKIALS